jgi:hypothetical protein
VTEASEDRCWNCGIVPKRWLDVTPPGLDEQRLVCSNCFARTLRPVVYYGWARPRSPDWEDDDEEEAPRLAPDSVADRASAQPARRRRDRPLLSLGRRLFTGQSSRGDV